MRTIVLSHWDMQPQATELVREICAQAGAEVRNWSSSSHVDSLGGRAALAVGVLPEGARRIPDDLATLVTQRIPGLPLLLWTQEPLVRPSCSLHEGLVTLLGPAPSTALVASCMRALMTDPLPASPDGGAYWPAASSEPDEAPGASRRRAYRMGSFWIGVLEGGDTLWDRFASRAYLRKHPLSVFFGPAEGAESQSEVERPFTVAVLDDPESPTWHFRANGATSLALISPQRLPSLTDLNRQPLSSVSAMPGDIVVALAPGHRWSELAPAVQERAEQDQGGAALLDHLQSKLANDGMASCLVIEKRS